MLKHMLSIGLKVTHTITLYDKMNIERKGPFSKAYLKPPALHCFYTLVYSLQHNWLRAIKLPCNLIFSLWSPLDACHRSYGLNGIHKVLFTTDFPYLKKKIIHQGYLMDKINSYLSFTHNKLFNKLMTVKWTFEGAISVFVCIFWSQLISNWQNTSQSEYATRVNKKHIFYYLRFYSNAPNKDLARLCSQPRFEKNSHFLSPNRGSN